MTAACPREVAVFMLAPALPALRFSVDRTPRPAHPSAEPCPAEASAAGLGEARALGSAQGEQRWGVRAKGTASRM